VTRERFEAILVGYVPKPISRGALVGNRFRVVMKDCCDSVEDRIEEAVEMAKQRKVPNFYGLQRFGTSGSGTHLVGRDLVNRRFGSAVDRMLLSGHPPGTEGRRMVEEAVSAGRYDEVASLLPPGKDVERMVAREAGSHPEDWVRAIRAAPIALRRLYVQAYQSFIFNKTLSRAVLRGEDLSAMKEGDNWAGVSEDGLTTSSVGGGRYPPKEGAVPIVQVVGYAYWDYGSRFDSLV
jgi:tRNA pseudouridine13 synthase